MLVCWVWFVVAFLFILGEDGLFGFFVCFQFGLVGLFVCCGGEGFFICFFLKLTRTQM